MLDKIINETSSAIVAATQGADDIVTALRSAVKNQVIGLLRDVGDVGGATLEEVVAVGAAAVGAVEGAINAAGALGADTAEAAHAAVNGAPATGGGEGVARLWPRVG